MIKTMSSVASSIRHNFEFRRRRIYRRWIGFR